jgi:hypothetical protein
MRWRVRRVRGSWSVEHLIECVVLDVTASGVGCVLRDYHRVSLTGGVEGRVQNRSVCHDSADDDRLDPVAGQEARETCIDEFVWSYVIGDHGVAGLVCDCWRNWDSCVEDRYPCSSGFLEQVSRTRYGGAGATRLVGTEDKVQQQQSSRLWIQSDRCGARKRWHRLGVGVRTILSQHYLRSLSEDRHAADAVGAVGVSAEELTHPWATPIGRGKRIGEPYLSYVLAVGVACVLVSREVVEGQTVIRGLFGPVCSRDDPEA